MPFWDAWYSESDGVFFLFLKFAKCFCLGEFTH